MTVDLFASRLAAVSAFIALMAGFWCLAGVPSDQERSDFGARYGAMMARSARPIFLVSTAVSVVALVVWLIAPAG